MLVVCVCVCVPVQLYIHAHAHAYEKLKTDAGYILYSPPFLRQDL